MLNIFYKVIAGIATVFMMLYGVIGGINNFDTVSKYEENIMQVEFYENTLETAVPQTELYNIINEHFNSELPFGKLTKKAIVIGYDGCRADALTLVEEYGAIPNLLYDGAKAYISYCGGVNYPVFNKQDTSTAPGWASILTGQWADVTGVTGNGIPMAKESHTLFSSLIENGKADSSAFYVSWNGHFVDGDATYIHEKAYCEENDLNVIFSDAGDDAGTVQNTLDDINGLLCSDFIFTILEHTDHAGHGTGFDLENEDYANAFLDCEADATTIINAIEARATYALEDWMIIITSDHGGFNTGHGAFTIQERMTFFVVK